MERHHERRCGSGRGSKKKEVAIEELLALAVACIGMSYDDFCRCTPFEFNAIAETWQKLEEAKSREAWERARLCTTLMMQPHCNKTLKPHDLIPLPWDVEEEKKSPTVSRAEAKRRFERLVARIPTTFGTDTEIKKKNGKTEKESNKRSDI